MKYLTENNRNPQDVKFWEVHKLLMEDGNGVADLKSRVKVAGQTVAAFALVGHDDPQQINIWYYDTLIATLFDDDAVMIRNGGYDTVSTKRRIDWCLIPLGYRLTTVRKTWKVYSIQTGAYRDFFEGMVVRKGEF